MGMPLATSRMTTEWFRVYFLKLPNLKLFSNHWNPDPSGHCAAELSNEEKKSKRLQNGP